MQNLKKIYHQEVTQKLIARFETDRETNRQTEKQTDRQRNRDDELIKALVIIIKISSKSIEFKYLNYFHENFVHV